MLASILSVAANIGYPSVFLLVLAESAGVPLPGETALVTGALLASQHKLQIPVVIALAASGAIVGDDLGYLIGRKGGRWLLERPGPFARSRREVLNVGVPFFEKHGARAVFFGRWLIGLAHLGLVARRRHPHAAQIIRDLERRRRDQLGDDDRACRLLRRVGRQELHNQFWHLRAGDLDGHADGRGPVGTPPAAKCGPSAVSSTLDPGHEPPAPTRMTSSASSGRPQRQCPTT